MKVRSVKYHGIYIQNNIKWDMVIETRIKSLFKLKHLFKYLSHHIDKNKLCYFVGLRLLVLKFSAI